MFTKTMCQPNTNHKTKSLILFFANIKMMKSLLVRKSGFNTSIHHIEYLITNLIVQMVKSSLKLSLKIMVYHLS